MATRESRYYHDGVRFLDFTPFTERHMGLLTSNDFQNGCVSFFRGPNYIREVRFRILNTFDLDFRELFPDPRLVSCNDVIGGVDEAICRDDESTASIKPVSEHGNNRVLILFEDLFLVQSFAVGCTKSDYQESNSQPVHTILPSSDSALDTMPTISLINPMDSNGSLYH